MFLSCLSIQVIKESDQLIFALNLMVAQKRHPQQGLHVLSLLYFKTEWIMTWLYSLVLKCKTIWKWTFYLGRIQNPKWYVNGLIFRSMSHNNVESSFFFLISRICIVELPSIRTVCLAQLPSSPLFGWDIGFDSYNQDVSHSRNPNMY